MNLRSRGWRLNLSLPLLLVAVAVVGVGFVLGEEVGVIQSVVVQPGREGGVVGRPWWKWSKWSWGLFGKEAGECEEHYGIMPCSTSLGGNAALLVIYGYCLLNAAQLLSAGSELLLTVMSPGLIGGLVLPILGAFPDALLITVSGLGASQAEAQEQVLVGMGLVAGSSVMVLTALWGSCLIVGRCDLVTVRGNLVAKDKSLENGFSLTGTGVTTDRQTQWASWIMIATLLPYLVAQIPRLFGLDTGGHLCIAIAAFISVGGLVAYCTYQLMAPWYQEKRIYWAQHKYRKTHAIQRVSHMSQKENWGSLFNDDGSPNDKVLGRLFDHFDEADEAGNRDEHLTPTELKALIMGLGIQRYNGEVPDAQEVQHWMKEFDTHTKDDLISKDEFLAGMMRWIKSFKTSFKKSGSSSRSPHQIWDTEAQVSRIICLATDVTVALQLIGAFCWDLIRYVFLLAALHNAKLELSTLMAENEDDDDSDEENASAPSRAQIIWKAVGYLVAGAAVAAIFADPLVDAIGGFSKASGISPFFISFIATPLATNSSEAISSLLFATRKRKRNMSMTYSQIYGAVTMNNTMCLGIFLAIVYFRGLVWDFSAEVSVILFATLVMGGIAAVRKTFPLWMAFIGLALYPASIGLVAFLDYVCGWH